MVCAQRNCAQRLSLNMWWVYSKIWFVAFLFLSAFVLFREKKNAHRKTPSNYQVNKLTFLFPPILHNSVDGRLFGCWTVFCFFLSFIFSLFFVGIQNWNEFVLFHRIRKQILWPKQFVKNIVKQIWNSMAFCFFRISIWLLATDYWLIQR